MFNLNRDQGHPETGERRARAAEISEELRVTRHGIEVVAHGALVCPDCAMPVAANGSTPVQEAISCGYCGHTDRAREFLVKDVFDTVANEVYMVARLPIRVT